RPLLPAGRAAPWAPHAPRLRPVPPAPPPPPPPWGQVARSASRRSSGRAEPRVHSRLQGALLVLSVVLLPGILTAQDASPYVPLQHWTMPYVEHLIARGVIPDPTPLTRPLKRGDLIRVLRGVDTLAVGDK